MKIKCPLPEHTDDNPSCEIYTDGGFCFVCNKLIPLSKLGLDVKIDRAPKQAENLEERNKYIDGLKIDNFRGFLLPFDETGYYIRYPNSLYYVCRLFTGPNKYKNPTGHPMPLYWASRQGKSKLCIAEGQINALSLSKAFPEYDVCSPGGTSQFDTKNIKRYLQDFLKYTNILVITDPDPAGIKAMIEVMGLLYTQGPLVSHMYLSPDANEILQNHGKDELRKQIEQKM